MSEVEHKRLDGIRGSEPGTAPWPDGSAHPKTPTPHPQLTGENLTGQRNAKTMPKTSWERVWKQHAPKRPRMGIRFPAVTPTPFCSGFAYQLTRPPINAPCVFLLTCAIYSAALKQRARIPRKLCKIGPEEHIQSLSTTTPIRYLHMSQTSPRPPRRMFLPQTHQLLH